MSPRRAFPVALLCALLVTPVLSAHTFRPLEPGIIIVGFDRAIPPEAETIVARHGGVIVDRLDSLPFVAVHTQDKLRLLSGLQLEGKVRHAYENGLGTLHEWPDDEDYPNQRPYLQAQHVPAAWSLLRGAGDRGVVIAVIDQGVDLNHTDLAGHLLTNEQGGYGYNLVPPGFNHQATQLNHLDYWGEERSPESHGTRTASVAVAIHNNGVHTSGVAGNVSIMPIRITFLSPDGETEIPHEWLAARAILLAAKNGADVIVTTWGFGDDLNSSTFRAALASAVASAHAAGVTIVSSAGNPSALTPTTTPMKAPATFPEVLAVGPVSIAADGANSSVAYYPNGSAMDFAAPHRAFTFCGRAASGCQPWGTGTSFSAPQVAGVVALMLSCRPDLHPLDVRNILTETAIDVTNGPGAGSGWDNVTGHGMVNAEAALQRACP